MEEDIAKALRGQDIHYNPIGYFVGSNGEYLPAVEYGGQTYYSDVPIEEVESHKKDQNKAESMGFTPTSNGAVEIYDEVQEFLKNFPEGDSSLNIIQNTIVPNETLPSNNKVINNRDSALITGLFVTSLITLVFILLWKYWFKIKEMNTKISKDTNHYLSAFIASLFVSTYFGFRFKILNSYGLMFASDEGTLWQKELFVSMLKERSCFFCFKTELYRFKGVTVFSFNWELFLGLLLFFMFIALVLKKTVLLEYIKTYILKK
jgi:hypothetical protein